MLLILLFYVLLHPPSVLGGAGIHESKFWVNRHVDAVAVYAPILHTDSAIESLCRTVIKLFYNGSVPYRKIYFL